MTKLHTDPCRCQDDLDDAAGRAVDEGVETVEQGAEAAADSAKQAVHDTAVKVEQATDDK